MSNSFRPHGLQPTRLLCPWDFPGKSTGVGCCCLLQRVFFFNLMFWIGASSFYSHFKHCQKREHAYLLKRYACLLSGFSQLYGLWPTKLLCPGRNTGVSSYALLQGIFATRGLNPCLTSPALAGQFFTPGGFLGGSVGEESTCSAGDLGSVPGLGRSSGEGNSYPLQHAGLENSMGPQRDCVTFTFTSLPMVLPGTPCEAQARGLKDLQDVRGLPGCACAVLTHSVIRPTPGEQQPATLLCPWYLPGKNTGVGCCLPEGSSWPRDWTCVSCIGRWILHGFRGSWIRSGLCQSLVSAMYGCPLRDGACLQSLFGKCTDFFCILPSLNFCSLTNSYLTPNL